MKLSRDYGGFVRFGLVVLGLAGYVFAAGDALIPQEAAMFTPTETPRAFAELVTTTEFRLWAARGLLGVHMELIGTIALFFAFAGTDQERLAFWGMLLAALADLFSTGLFTWAAFVFPRVGEAILAGNESAAAMASLESFMPVMGAGFIVTAVGLTFFAVAIWRSDRFPRWSGILALVGWVGLLVQGSYVIQIAANAVWGTAYLWMAIASWRFFSSPRSS